MYKSKKHYEMQTGKKQPKKKPVFKKPVLKIPSKGKIIKINLKDK